MVTVRHSYALSAGQATLGHLRASGPTETQTLFQNARWTAPEEQRQRLTSDLHMHIHACAPVLIITDIKLRKISE